MLLTLLPSVPQIMALGVIQPNGRNLFLSKNTGYTVLPKLTLRSCTESFTYYIWICVRKTYATVAFYVLTLNNHAPSKKNTCFINLFLHSTDPVIPNFFPFSVQCSYTRRCSRATSVTEIGVMYFSITYT